MKEDIFIVVEGQNSIESSDLISRPMEIRFKIDFLSVFGIYEKFVQIANILARFVSSWYLNSPLKRFWTLQARQFQHPLF